VSDDALHVQGDWDASKLHRLRPRTPDGVFMMERLREMPVAFTRPYAHGRLLEVAAAEAVHASRLALAGATSVALEPSPTMLVRARARAEAMGARLGLVRGIAETMPFADATFDCVLCDSAIDHFADPEHGISEMTRVLKPGGRLVLSVVNYGSLTVPASRVLYALGRRSGRVSADALLAWDTPVPFEHTFECTWDRLLALCEPYLELERAEGVGAGWMLPGWGRVLGAMPAGAARGVLRLVDRVARRAPAVADYVITAWRPRPAARAGVSVPSDLRVRADDVVYQSRREAEARYWERSTVSSMMSEVLRGSAALARAAYPDRGDWLDDLVSRGPFADAAVLGCDDEDFERRWVERRASARLDVYELSARVLAGVGESLPSREGVRLVAADLNFVELPAAAYDVVWSSGVLHHVANLERLYDQVARALRPGGLFALHDYVGERRLQYGAARLARINAVLADVPARFRRGGIDRVQAPGPETLSPFCGVRADEVVPLAEARFEVVHRVEQGPLFPLYFMLDVAGMAREDPDAFARLVAAERAADADPAVRHCSAYLVLRRR